MDTKKCLGKRYILEVGLTGLGNGFHVGDTRKGKKKSRMGLILLA